MNKTVSLIALALSMIAVILAIISAFSSDVWLAATQWLIVAAVLGIYALFFKK